jgi:hypothetical protein
MKKDLSGKLALDTSALIELVLSTTSGLKLKEALKAETIETSTTTLNITELRYVLCRKLGSQKANDIVDKLLASGYITVEDISPLTLEASMHKCTRAISLCDCFTLALADKSSSAATFARKEKELITEMQKKPFHLKIIFLEDYV